MARSNRNTRKSKARSSVALSPKKKQSKGRKNVEPEQARLVLQPRDGNVGAEPSYPSSSPEQKPAPKKRNGYGNGRPPLPKKKATKKTIAKHKEVNKEAELTDSDDEMSPLKKKIFLSRQSTDTIAMDASNPVRPRRRAAAAKKKQYVDVDVDDATDEETSSDESEDDYAAKKKARAVPISRNTNKRKKTAPAARKTSRKKSTPSPKATRNPTKKAAATAASAAASSAAGTPTTKKTKTKRSPSVFSTPQGATIGLTPIQDSVSKVWKSDGGDWRVRGAIDYQGL